MATPKQFLESFLQEKTAAWAVARPHLSAVHAKFFGEPLSRHSEHFMPPERVRAVVEDVRQSDGMTAVIIREHVRRADIRTRYRLAAVERAGRLSALITSAFYAEAQDSPVTHDVRSAMERDGMSSQRCGLTRALQLTAAPLGSWTVRVICSRLLQPTGRFRRRSLSLVVR